MERNKKLQDLRDKRAMQYRRENEPLNIEQKVFMHKTKLIHGLPSVLGPVENNNGKK